MAGNGEVEAEEGEVAGGRDEGRGIAERVAVEVGAADTPVGEAGRVGEEKADLDGLAFFGGVVRGGFVGPAESNGSCAGDRRPLVSTRWPA